MDHLLSNNSRIRAQFLFEKNMTWLEIVDYAATSADRELWSK